MKKKPGITFIIIFFLVCLGDFIGILTNINILEDFCKPLIIPALIIQLIIVPQIARRKNLLLIGLYFSWAGDVLIMFQNENQLFFIFGLISFLVTHIFYIIYFLKIRSVKISFLKKYPIFFFLVIAFTSGLLWFLFPQLGNMKIPVIIYAITISIMLLCSLHIYYKVNAPANLFFVLGATFFVLSDSILAINKFHHAFAGAGLLIMITYCTAQFLIVKGYLKQMPNG